MMINSSKQRSEALRRRIGRWTIGASALIASLAFANSALAFINVVDFGAKGDGSDATSAIQAAINSAGNNGDTVYLPAGTYGVSSSITVTNVMGLRILGDGIFATKIQPSVSMAGKPVMLLTDTMHCTIESLSVLGNSGGPPSAGIESLSAPGGESTHLNVRDVQIGSLSTNSIVDGVVYTAPANADWNNDLGFFQNVTIYNFTHAGYSFSGINTLGHTIEGGQVGYGPIGVYSQGGSFKMTGTHFDSLTDVVFDLENVSNGTWGFYQHPIEISNVSSEADAATLLRTGTDSVIVSITNLDYKFSPAGAAIVNFQSPGTFFMNGSTMFMVGANASMRFVGGPRQVVNLTNNYLALSNLTVDGRLMSMGNCWNGNPTVSATSRSTLTSNGEACGKFPKGPPKH